MLHIKDDKDIAKVAMEVVVTRETLEKFEEGTIEIPPLEPLQVNLDDLKHPWNEELSDVFTDDFLAENPELSHRRPEVKVHFHARLRALRTALLKHCRREGEQPEDVFGRMEREYQANKQIRRVLRRQDALRSDRIKICEQQARDGDATWTQLFAIMEELPSNGPSSDESGNEVGRTYAVRVKQWRSDEITKIVQYVDKHRITTNAYGNALPGNHSRNRVRHTYPPLSKVEACAQLPLNFYNAAWWGALRRSETRNLESKPDMVLPKVPDL
ncbi:hypothetical protein FPV67DRAFT_1664045 [Lyophyllum atratum]|nr:hypothetical protein FPV67DRAFT_1664045 [Lyophyllum atratum]